MNQRALQRFDSTIHSEQTRKNYKRDLNSFIKFNGIKDYDSILSIPSEAKASGVRNEKYSSLNPAYRVTPLQP